MVNFEQLVNDNALARESRKEFLNGRNSNAIMLMFSPAKIDSKLSCAHTFYRSIFLFLVPVLDVDTGQGLLSKRAFASLLRFGPRAIYISFAVFFSEQ